MDQPDLPTREDTGQDFARLWPVITRIVAPTTLVVALLMYVGSLRTNTTYRGLGVDQSMLGLSVQDYLLRSISATFEPLALILLVLLIALPAHVLLAHALARHRKAADRIAAVLAVLGVAACLLGVAGLAGWMELSVGFPVVSMSLGLGVFALGYSFYLYAVISPRRVWSGTEPRSVRIVRRVVFAAFLALMLLWTVAVFAQLRGASLIDEWRRDPAVFSGVVVYSPQRLYLEGSGVTESELPSKDAKYHYRYSGLRLLIHANQRYFLLPACWATTPEARAIALPDDNSLRLEFFRVAHPPLCP